MSRCTTRGTELPTGDWKDRAMDVAKRALLQYLRDARAALLSKLDGIDEHDRRRPLTGTGTNLLGLVKHLVGVELGYFGDSFGRPGTESLPWFADASVWDGADMWATEEESSEYLVGLYRSAWELSDATIEELDLATPASVPWWPEERRDTDLATLLVRVLDDTARHAGQADIVRELIDGRGGSDQESFGDHERWRRYVERIEAAAGAFRTS
jgi:uncharacterized damage-inducible protein DinB